MTSGTLIGKHQWTLRGERLEQARGYLGYSQGVVAELVSELLGKEISHQIIHVLEKGDRDIRGDELYALVEVLQQSREWLEGLSGAAFNQDAKNRVSDLMRIMGLSTHQIELEAA